MTAAYPADYLACSDCEAPRAQPCYSLFADGPEALPPQFAGRPHPKRPVQKGARRERGKADGPGHPVPVLPDTDDGHAPRPSPVHREADETHAKEGARAGHPPALKRRGPVPRRQAAKTSSQVAAWQSLAAKQRGKP